ncbi:MAG: FAD-dependent oxidoreductase [Chloroflexi bacterium]|nr:FAD-dependent oxidoreductase [Chloroflexota bacterium]MCY3938432.1 FAD-dependent oxidoreductase [Chloroflexota bacterium]
MTEPTRSFPNLFSPFTINKMKLRNRITVPPHFAGLWMNSDGVPSDAFVAYLAERAKGGAALVGVGATVVRPGDHPGYYQNLDDSFILQYKKVADAVHRYGAKVIAQFCPRGPDIRYQEVGEPFPRPAAAGPLASAPYPGVSADWHVSTYSVEDLQETAYCTGLAATRAKAGGADAVEIHAHEHHLHAQFLSPVVNKRSDGYGGSFNNRCRFLIHTLREMRGAVGQDFVVGLRMLARDLHPDGWVEDDSVRLIQMVTSEGLIDYVSLTAGVRWMHIGPMYQPDGEFLDRVGYIREQIDVPVIHAGRLTNPHLAESAIASGKVDLVGMVKGHIADPHFANKVQSGRLDEIRYCIRCLYCFDMEGAKCIYNPLTGRELEWGPLKNAASSKRVVIVGGGPAGIEAAMAAAERGHEVMVLEKRDRVGGEVWLAGAAPLRKKYLEIAEFYDKRARAAEFDLRLGTDATAENVMELRPDVVIVASGSRAIRPVVPGADGSVLSAPDVLHGAADEARSVLVVDREGRAPAFVAADYLSSKGVQVEFVAATPTVGQEMGELDLAGLYTRLENKGVSFQAGLDLLRLDGDEAIFGDILSGREVTLGPFDAVVLAAGSEPVNDLGAALEGRIDEVHVVGAANESLSIMDATVDGARVGRLV